MRYSCTSIRSRDEFHPSCWDTVRAYGVLRAAGNNVGASLQLAQKPDKLETCPHIPSVASYGVKCPWPAPCFTPAVICACHFTNHEKTPDRSLRHETCTVICWSSSPGT